MTRERGRRYQTLHTDYIAHLQIMCALGNARVNAIYEYEIPPHVNKPKPHSPRSVVWRGHVTLDHIIVTWIYNWIMDNGQLVNNTDSMKLGSYHTTELSERIQTFKELSKSCVPSIDYVSCFLTALKGSLSSVPNTSSMHSFTPTPTSNDQKSLHQLQNSPSF